MATTSTMSVHICPGEVVRLLTPLPADVRVARDAVIAARIAWAKAGGEAAPDAALLACVLAGIRLCRVAAEHGALL